MQYQSTPRPTYCPWGIIQSAHEVLPGIWSVSTSSHGGLCLSAERTNHIPYPFLAASFNGEGILGFFEEDCDMMIPMVVFEDEYRQHFKLRGYEQVQINWMVNTSKRYCEKLLEKEA